MIFILRIIEKHPRFNGYIMHLCVCTVCIMMIINTFTQMIIVFCERGEKNIFGNKPRPSCMYEWIS